MVFKAFVVGGIAVSALNNHVSVLLLYYFSAITGGIVGLISVAPQGDLDR